MYVKNGKQISKSNIPLMNSHAMVSSQDAWDASRGEQELQRSQSLVSTQTVETRSPIRKDKYLGKSVACLNTHLMPKGNKTYSRPIQRYGWHTISYTYE